MSEPVQFSHANDKSIVVNLLYYRNSKCINSNIELIFSCLKKWNNA